MTEQERGSAERWRVEKAPNGLDGVIFTSAETRRVLRYDEEHGAFITVPRSGPLVDELCVWDLEAIHRETYYLLASDGFRKLEAAKKGLGTSRVPVRLLSDEWKIESRNDKDPGIVTLFSNARQQYLTSNSLGEVHLVEKSPRDGSALWIIEEQESGLILRSQVTKRVLVAPESETICTVEPGTMVQGITRWKMEAKLPRQVNKEKMQAVGSAVAIGVVGSVATPLFIGSAIGALGVAHVGVAGEIAIGSIRAVEVLNTITRVTLSSSQLMITQSALLSADSDCDDDDGAMVNRPFCNWRSW